MIALEGILATVPNATHVGDPRYELCHQNVRLDVENGCIEHCAILERAMHLHAEIERVQPKLVKERFANTSQIVIQCS